MKKIVFALLLTVISISGAIAQYNTIRNVKWAFGTNAGVDFTSGSPVFFSTSMNSFEGHASVCDNSGNIMFYTEGTQVWDRTGAVMPSGSAIVSFVASSSTQAAVIAPVLSNPNQYYIFSLENISTGGGGTYCQLVYCIVDMTLNSGLGDVVAASISTPVNTKMAEKQMLVAGDNCDLWLVTHRIDSNKFLCYNINVGGISAPVVSTTGFFSGTDIYGIGYIKASPDRRHIVSQQYTTGTGTELYDFNPTTGIVSNCIRLDSSATEYGAEFSPDNTKLYCEDWGSQIDQYDLTAGSASAIRSSRTTVVSSGPISELKLAPDGKIYFANSFGGTTLSCIPNPNTAGTGCGYVATALTLTGGAGTTYGLPNVFVAPAGGDTVRKVFNRTLCIPTAGYVLNADTTGTSYIWSTGATTPTITITSLGTYWVVVGNGCTINIDTFHLVGPATTVTSHVHDTSVCAIYFPITLTATAGFTTYTWVGGGGTTRTHLAPTTGTYWSRAADSCGNITADTFHVSFTPPDTTIGTTTSYNPCISLAPFTLTATTGFTGYRWNTGSLTNTTNVSASGIYWVYKTNNCSVIIDTFIVDFIPLPVLDLGADVMMCVGDSLVLSSTQPAGTVYAWSTGSTGDSIHVSTSGTYWLRLYNGCTITDSIHVLVSPYPVVDLGPDTFNCQGNPMTIQSLYTYPFPTYLWSTGAGTASETVVSTGNYWLQVTVAGCTSADTIHVTIQFDTFTLLNRDTAICRGKAVQAILRTNPIATVQWLPTAGISVSNVNNAYILPDTTASYVANIYIPGCPVVSDTFRIEVQPYPNVYVGGNRFVCLYDTIHINASVTPAWFTGYTYSWAPTTSLDFGNTKDVVFTAGASQKYILTVNTSAGCVGKDSTQIIVQPGNFGGVNPGFNLCPRDSMLLAGTGGVGYRWYPSLYLSDSLSPTPWIKPIGSVTYSLVVTSAVGCKDTVTLNVHVFPAALISIEDSVELYPGESVHISPLTNCNNFNWYPVAGLNSTIVSDPIANPEVDTKYFVFGTTADGCRAEDSISVHINTSSLLALPNAFTPGTGANNMFSIIKRGEATLNYFRVFNRWGNVVFETNNITQGWDGTFKGAPQPLGVYVYDVQAVTNSGVLFNKTGNVTLLR